MTFEAHDTRGNFYVEIKDKVLIELVASIWTPGDVFPEDKLERWAKDHGFVKEDEE